METPVPDSIHVGHAQLPGHIGEGSVVIVVIERVLASDGAVGDVNIGPAVAIKINDGNCGAHGCDFRHDGIELVVERRRLMNEVDACRVRDFLQIEPVPRDGCFRIQRCIFRLLRALRQPGMARGVASSPTKKIARQYFFAARRSFIGLPFLSALSKTSCVT